MDSTDVMYKLVNCWLIPNLFEARQAYSPSSASVTDSKTRGLEYTFPGPSSICPGFRTVKSWPFKSNVKSVGGLYNVSSTFLNHCEDIRNRKTKLFRHSPIITKLFLKNKQLHSMTGMSFFSVPFTRYNDMAWFDKKGYMWLWVYYVKFRYLNTRVAKGL